MLLKINKNGVDYFICLNQINCFYVADIISFNNKGVVIPKTGYYETTLDKFNDLNLKWSPFNLT